MLQHVFFQQHGHLNANKCSIKKRSGLSKQVREEDHLARLLDDVRRAKLQDVVSRDGIQQHRKDRQ